ncbi:787_t:CDS:2 [Ambispora leptoticha]|uniref:787_t:CDS:1 n=1 Tax=Ambispora leptoticha TaxID=144679 RepID=A0A9N9G321_9GLOM|nr:787_t:CDS:2 [Ambispora leptoticha]
MAISQDDTRIIYKSLDQRGEFFVLKWRKDKSIPLVDCVQSFEVYETVNGGNEGLAVRPSHQQLETCFGTSKPEEVVAQICEKGIIHNSRKGHDRPAGRTHRTMINETRGKGVSTSENTRGIHN